MISMPTPHPASVLVPPPQALNGADARSSAKTGMALMPIRRHRAKHRSSSPDLGQRSRARKAPISILDRSGRMPDRCHSINGVRRLDSRHLPSCGQNQRQLTCTGALRYHFPQTHQPCGQVVHGARGHATMAVKKPDGDAWVRQGLPSGIAGRGAITLVKRWQKINRQ